MLRIHDDEPDEEADKRSGARIKAPGSEDAFRALERALLRPGVRSLPADPEALEPHLPAVPNRDAVRMELWLGAFVREGRLVRFTLDGRDRIALPAVGRRQAPRKLAPVPLRVVVREETARDASSREPARARHEAAVAARVAVIDARPGPDSARRDGPTDERVDAPARADTARMPHPPAVIARVAPAAPVGPGEVLAPWAPSAPSAAEPRRSPRDEEATFELEVAVDVDEERVIVRRFTAVLLALIGLVLARELLLRWSETWR